MLHAISLGENVFRWVLQTSWQAATLAVVIWLAQFVLRERLAPAWRYGLWLLLVVRLILPATPPSAISIFNFARAPQWKPEISLAASYPLPQTIERANDSFHDPINPSQNAIQSSTPAVPSSTPQPSARIAWFDALLCAWLVGVGYFGARLIWTNSRFYSQLLRRHAVTDDNALSLLHESRAALRIRRVVRLTESDEVESPAVYGLYRMWLLLPEGAIERFSQNDLRCIFLHELAHIKRRDVEVNWLVSILQCLHWFNPVLWLAFARMRADRELAADALALTRVAQTENVAYGETILKVVENLAHVAAQPGLVGIAESKSGLKKRLRAIARSGTIQSWRWAAIAAAAIVAGVGLTSAEQNDPKHQSDATTPGVSAPFELPSRISGFILDPSGQRADQVQVALIKPASQVSLQGGPHLFNPQFPHSMSEHQRDDAPWNYCTTDNRGRFDLDDVSNSLFLVAANEKGFAQISTNEFSTHMTVHLHTWSRIEGTLRDYDNVETNGTISVGAVYFEVIPWIRDTKFETKADSQGRFTFPCVPPGWFAVFAPGARRLVTVKPAEDVTLSFGDVGRPVIGRFTVPYPHPKFEWGRKHDDFYWLETALPKQTNRFKTREESEAWEEERAKHAPNTNDRAYNVSCAPDGSFHIDHVEPGKYDLTVLILNPTNQYSYPNDPKKLGYANLIAQCRRTFEIPAGKSNNREPVNLGVVELQPPKEN